LQTHFFFSKALIRTDFRSGFRKEKVPKVDQLGRSKVDHFYTIVDSCGFAAEKLET
jgi:hypothetical protein